MDQLDFQDPKMEVLYHIRPYVVGIFPEIKPSKTGLIYGRYLQFRFLKWSLNGGVMHFSMIYGSNQYLASGNLTVSMLTWLPPFISHDLVTSH